jgi:hypothetical protein
MATYKDNFERKDSVLGGPDVILPVKLVLTVRPSALALAILPLYFFVAVSLATPSSLLRKCGECIAQLHGEHKRNCKEGLAPENVIRAFCRWLPVSNVNAAGASKLLPKDAQLDTCTEIKVQRLRGGVGTKKKTKNKTSNKVETVSFKLPFLNVCLSPR